MSSASRKLQRYQQQTRTRQSIRPRVTRFPHEPSRKPERYTMTVEEEARQKVAIDADIKYFEDNPDATEYERDYVEGEVLPGNLPEGVKHRVHVRKLGKDTRARMFVPVTAETETQSA